MCLAWAGLSENAVRELHRWLVRRSAAWSVWAGVPIDDVAVVAGHARASVAGRQPRRWAITVLLTPLLCFAAVLARKTVQGPVCRVGNWPLSCGVTGRGGGI